MFDKRVFNKKKPYTIYNIKAPKKLKGLTVHNVNRNIDKWMLS